MKLNRRSMLGGLAGLVGIKLALGEADSRVVPTPEGELTSPWGEDRPYTLRPIAGEPDYSGWYEARGTTVAEFTEFMKDIDPAWDAQFRCPETEAWLVGRYLPHSL